MRVFAYLIAFVALTACSGNPLDRLTRLSHVKIADDPVAVAVAEAVDDDDTLPEADETVVAEVLETPSDPTAEKGFFARMLSNVLPAEADDTAPVDDAPADVVVADVALQTPAPDTPIPAVLGVTADLADEVPVAELVPAPQQAGFFGRMFNGLRATPKTDEADVVTAVAPAPANVGVDGKSVTVGTVLPYGEIATNCDVSRRQLGTKVGEGSGYTLYDTIPNATTLRTHYITGFKDRCARQFSAATALMGDIGTHEVVRYLPSNKRMAYSDTDNAYETLKASFCWAGRGEPCGSRLDRFAKTTTFVTVYRNFGSNPTWSNILLHKGAVIEMGSAAR